MSEKRFFTSLANDEYTLIQKKGNPRSTYLKYSEVVDLLNEMSERIDEQQSFIGRKLLGFDKYLAERLNEEEEIIKEQENIIKQLDQKIKDKNEYQQVLESKIRRLKDRIKVLEK